MIWVGRFLSVPVGLLFFILLLVTLILLRVNDTFLDPDFYPDELRKANMYEFVLVDLLTAAINERMRNEAAEMAKGEGVESTPLLTSGLSAEDIVASVNRAVPPVWVQGLVEESFDQVGKYLNGERDEFAFTLAAGDRVDTLVDEFKSLIRKSDAYELLFQEAINPAIEDAVAGKLPLGVEFTSDRLEEAARLIITREWVEAEVDEALDELSPYVVRDRDTFTVAVHPSTRVDIALEEIKQLLREADLYELLYTEVVDPRLEGMLGDSVELPLGVGVTEEEVLSALRRVAPVEWVQEQVELLIDEVGPYVAGNTDAFTFDVSLVDNKKEAGVAIGELVDQRLAEVIDGIKECGSLEDARAALSVGTGGVPSCLPPNTPIDQVMRRLDIAIADAVQDLVLGPIPDTVAFDEGHLRSALELAGAGDNLDQFDEVREILRDGRTYTQEDLREELTQDGDSSNAETLEDIRAFLADGWTYTHTDFRQDISEDPDADGLRILDAVRDGFKLSRQYRFVIYVPLVLLLVVIGFIGGRTWSGRVAWAAAFLIVSAGTVYAIFGPGYDSFAKSGPIYDAVGISALDELRTEVLDGILNDLSGEGNEYPDTARLVANKGFDVAESIADDFASGVNASALSVAIVGLVTLGIAIFWAALVNVVSRFLPGKKREPEFWEKPAAASDLEGPA